MHIKACFSLPAPLAIFLVFECDQIFVDQRERLREVLLRVCVEVGRVILDHVAQLFLLHLPNIVPLAAIGKDFDTLGNLDARLEWPTRTHISDVLSVGYREIALRLHGACS